MSVTLLWSSTCTPQLQYYFYRDAADKVVQGHGKFEQLTVASQEIAASTAQLVCASRVKAEPRSKSLQALGESAKAVSFATGNVVATAKHCSQLVEDSGKSLQKRLKDRVLTVLSFHSHPRLHALDASSGQTTWDGVSGACPGTGIVTRERTVSTCCSEEAALSVGWWKCELTLHSHCLHYHCQECLNRLGRDNPLIHNENPEYVLSFLVLFQWWH